MHAARKSDKLKGVDLDCTRGPDPSPHDQTRPETCPSSASRTAPLVVVAPCHPSRWISLAHPGLRHLRPRLTRSVLASNAPPRPSFVARARASPERRVLRLSGLRGTVGRLRREVSQRSRPLSVRLTVLLILCRGGCFWGHWGLRAAAPERICARDWGDHHPGLGVGFANPR